MNFNIDCDSNSRPLVWEHGGAHSFRLADTRRVLSTAPTVILEFSTNRSRCPDIRRQNRSSLPSSCLNCPEFAVAYPSRKPSRVPWSPIFPKLLLIAFVIHHLVATASHYLRQFFRFQALEFLARTGDLHFRHPYCALTNIKRYRIRVDPLSHRYPLFNRILLSPAELFPVRR
jgi:hypothetical protein